MSAPTNERHRLLAELRSAIHERESGLAPATQRVPTGFASLDGVLQGGLLRGALNEIYPSEPGSGIAQALLPAICRMPAPDGAAPRLLAWVHPTLALYPPAVAQASGGRLDRWIFVTPPNAGETLWAIEQALRSRACDAVLGEVDVVSDTVLRRLQLAAQEGRALALFFRSPAALRVASPAALRLAVRPLPSAASRRRRLEIDFVRCRGLAFAAPLLLEWNVDALAECPPAAAPLRTPDAGAGDEPRRAVGYGGTP
jgi:protein ImuA